MKGLVGLTASPTVTASASTGWNDLTLGGQATFDTAKDESLTAWTAGVGGLLHIDCTVLGNGQIAVSQAFPSKNLLNTI